MNHLVDTRDNKVNAMDLLSERLTLPGIEEASEDSVRFSSSEARLAHRLLKAKTGLPGIFRGGQQERAHQRAFTAVSLLGLSSPVCHVSLRVLKKGEGVGCWLEIKSFEQRTNIVKQIYFLLMSPTRKRHSASITRLIETIQVVQRLRNEQKKARHFYKKQIEMEHRQDCRATSLSGHDYHQQWSD